jgi:hypothetical protein
MSTWENLGHADPPAFRTRDFSKLNEKRCKYDRSYAEEALSPLDAMSSSHPKDGLQTDQNYQMHNDGWERNHARSVDKLQFLTMKQELLEGVRGDLLEMGRAVVGTIRQEVVESSHNLGLEMRGGMAELKTDMKALLQVQCVKMDEITSPKQSPRILPKEQASLFTEHFAEASDAVQNDTATQDVQEMRKLCTMSSRMYASLHDDILGVKAGIAAREQRMEEDFASVLQAIDRRITKVTADVDLSAVIDEIKSFKNGFDLKPGFSSNSTMEDVTSSIRSEIQSLRADLDARLSTSNNFSGSSQVESKTSYEFDFSATLAAIEGLKASNRQNSHEASRKLDEMLSNAELGTGLAHVVRTLRKATQNFDSLVSGASLPGLVEGLQVSHRDFQELITDVHDMSKGTAQMLSNGRYSNSPRHSNPPW